MKFNCDRSLLISAVLNVSRMIPSKSSIPALEGIKITASSENTLTLTGYDMEAGITTVISANVETPGEIVLSARLFSDMIRKMDGDIINVNVGEKYLTQVTSALTEFTILGIPAEEFPQLPKVEKEDSVTLKGSILKSMIDQTLFAIAITDTKPVHTGSLFHIGDGKLTLVSVDGYRLAMRKEEITTSLDTQFVVPGKVLSEISKIIDEDSENDVSIFVSGRHIIFEVDNYSVISRLLEGDFLDYASSIPQGNTGKVKISTRGFIDSVERASLLISDRLRSPLRITFSNKGTVDIKTSTSLGRFYDEVKCDCKLEEDSLEMGFNNKYLLDALKAAESDQVLIETNGSLSPIKVLPMEGDSFLFLVLPVRLKNDF